MVGRDRNVFPQLNGCYGRSQPPSRRNRARILKRVAICVKRLPAWVRKSLPPAYRAGSTWDGRRLRSFQTTATAQSMENQRLGSKIMRHPSCTPWKFVTQGRLKPRAANTANRAAIISSPTTPTLKPTANPSVALTPDSIRPTIPLVATGINTGSTTASNATPNRTNMRPQAST